MHLICYRRPSALTILPEFTGDLLCLLLIDFSHPLAFLFVWATRTGQLAIAQRAIRDPVVPVCVE